MGVGEVGSECRARWNATRRALAARRRAGRAETARQRELRLRREAAQRSAKQRARFMAMPERERLELFKERCTWQKYGITVADREWMLGNQLGLCAICRRRTEFRVGGAAVDHDHRTGAVRGVLCFSCNGNLGWLEKNRLSIEVYLSGAWFR